MHETHKYNETYILFNLQKYIDRGGEAVAFLLNYINLATNVSLESCVSSLRYRSTFSRMFPNNFAKSTSNGTT